MLYITIFCKSRFRKNAIKSLFLKPFLMRSISIDTKFNASDEYECISAKLMIYKVDMRPFVQCGQIGFKGIFI